MIRRFEETEETRKIIARLAKENNSDRERWIQIYTEATGFDDEQKKTVAKGIRRAVEARRKGAGREPPHHRSKARACVSQKKRCKKRENGRNDSLKNEGEHKKRAKKSGKSKV